jgi:molybdopterin-guanine dinucleotide biosynthesis protein A
MNQAYAVIIAGGRGARLGSVRKADLRIGGIRLIERIAMVLDDVTAPLLVAVGPQDNGLALPEGAMAVLDPPAATGGPLAGLAAAVAALQARGISDGILLSATVDTPFLPADFAPRMLGALEGHDAGFACWGEDFYPPNAVWRIAALAELPQRVLRDDAPPSLKALLAEISACRVDWAADRPVNPFANLNTLAELVALGQRARR